MSDQNGLPRPDEAMARFSSIDMKRLTEAAGRKAREILGDEDEMFAGIIFVMRSRDDDAYTWEQALAAPWGDHLNLTPDVPPPTPPPALPGGSGGSSTGRTSRSRPTTSAKGRS